jgi:hypothetical protein
MPIFRGNRVTRTNGSGAGRGDNAHYQPPAPAQPAQESKPAPSGRGMYQIHGKEGGGYVRTTPTEGREGRRHDVTYYSDDHKPQYSVSDASFNHDEKTGKVSFHGGIDSSSNTRMGHVWSKQSFGGNTHQDMD